MPSTRFYQAKLSLLRASPDKCEHASNGDIDGDGDGILSHGYNVETAKVRQNDIHRYREPRPHIVALLFFLPGTILSQVFSAALHSRRHKHS